MPRASNVSPSQIQNWVRFYKSAPEGYKPHALTAVLRNDGPQMLAAVLKALGLVDGVALVKDWEGEPRPERSTQKDGRDVALAKQANDSLPDVP